MKLNETKLANDRIFGLSAILAEPVPGACACTGTSQYPEVPKGVLAQAIGETYLFNTLAEEEKYLPMYKLALKLNATTSNLIPFETMPDPETVARNKRKARLIFHICRPHFATVANPENVPLQSANLAEVA